MQRGKARSAPLLHKPAANRGTATKPRKQPRARKRITLRQASNIMAAVAFTKLIDLHLVAHLTIHWSRTDIGDDPDGKLLAKLREGLSKWLGRRGIVFTAAWCRERQSGGQSDVVHCHLLFHLPVAFRKGRKLHQVEAAISRLVELHGGGIFHEKAIDLRVHSDPDGKYLIKGGGHDVWKRFRIRKKWRKPQGIIYGKRCGTTQNIGPLARERGTGLTSGRVA